MKRVILACAGVLALSGVAAAADLPPAPGPAPYYKAPAYLPGYNWSGFYLGINGGGAWGDSNWTTPGRVNTSGGLVGGTIGYNYQINQAVLGVEGDIDWADINGTLTNTACPVGCKTTDSWLSTVRGRLGYAADRFMPYVTGGLAVGNIEASIPGLASTNTTNAGWTLGGGIEFAIAGHWTAKAEYLYVDLGNTNVPVTGGPAQNVSFKANVFRGGVNYRF
ncbi:MAG TPA: outer membrane protein [Xanthobacteraceae bacterium]|nr:outer membrane protein [Xanthobacteraceae bacterium]